MPHLDGFWLGMATALPVYFLLDHFVIPWLIDQPISRMVRSLRSRGRE